MASHKFNYRRQKRIFLKFIFTLDGANDKKTNDGGDDISAEENTADDAYEESVSSNGKSYQKCKVKCQTSATALYSIYLALQLLKLKSLI